jgi:disintegrin and metalloproteinase domain-containing protein 10
MYAKPGTPCNDYIGYCDVFQKCREVDPSGPLATLRKLLLSEESIASFKKWVISNWYAVSLIIVAVFALLVSFSLELNKVYFCFQTITQTEYKSQDASSHLQKMGKI